ncbi:phosphoglycerate kinase [bacterium]|nr:phosphoglycerate kinase [bacterium]
MRYLKTLRKDLEVENKKVLVRCDFNVPLSEKGEILDDYRIRQTIPTIEYLIKRGAKVILISHLGRPGGVRNEKYSLKPIAKKLSELLGKKVIFFEDCIGERTREKIRELKPGEVILLENLRFYKGEEAGDIAFAKELATLGDVYVGDAFAVSHRAHASISEVPKMMPSGAGFLMEKEVDALLSVSQNPQRPLVVIIGGEKISTKIKIIEQFLIKAEHLLVGGQIANALLKARGISLGGPFLEKEMIERIKKINLTDPTIHLPVDVTVCLGEIKEGYIRYTAVGKVRKEEQILDLGPETAKLFSNIIKEAKTVFWNGPLGYFEEEKFAMGSLAIADAIIKSKAFSVAGGGETNAFLAKYNLRKWFSHVSTGGGAMLAFLSGEILPGIEVLYQK